MKEKIPIWTWSFLVPQSPHAAAHSLLSEDPQDDERPGFYINAPKLSGGGGRK
jgi:hypothetical protein